MSQTVEDTLKKVIKTVSSQQDSTEPDQEVKKSSVKASEIQRTLSSNKENFQVRIKIHEASRLSGHNIRPSVQVKCGPTQKRVTGVRKGSSPIWNETMMFNFTESLTSLSGFILEFMVNNARRARRNAPIGHFKLELGRLYGQPGHAYVRQWILLSAPDDSSITPQGYLKATICILGAGDHAPNDDESEDDDIEGNLLIPAGTTLRSGQFFLRVYKAEDLPNMDKGIGNKVKPDPYLKFRFGGVDRETSHKNDNNSPTWDEELCLPLRFPTMCETIHIELLDKDVTSYKVIGYVDVPISDISQETSDVGFLPTFGPCFLNIYKAAMKFDDGLCSRNIFQKFARKAFKNRGKYHGRVLLELVTEIGDGGPNPRRAAIQIDKDNIEAVEKYQRKVNYSLFVVMHEAVMISKTCAEKAIRFEVTMGNYGGKNSDKTHGEIRSTTEPKLATLGGHHYCHIAWGAEKPVICVASRWEPMEFRYKPLNFLQFMITLLEGDISRVNKKIAEKQEEEEIATEIIESLKALIKNCEDFCNMEPPQQQEATMLDDQFYLHRKKCLTLVAEDAMIIHNECKDRDEAVEAMEDYLKRVKEIAREFQDSMPDIIVWMFVKDKKIACARIPAKEIIYCRGRKEYCGKKCGRTHTIFLKDPRKEEYKIACQLEATLWLGRAEDDEAFEIPSTAKMCACIETDDKKSIEDKKFACPKGWKWDGKWFMSIQTVRLLSDEITTEEVYEEETRPVGGHWEKSSFMYKGKTVTDKRTITCQGGWIWQSDWEIDLKKDCDDEGWQYTDLMADEDVEWWPTDTDRSTKRRRLWFRTKKCVKIAKQAEQETEVRAAEEGWEIGSRKKVKRWMRPIVRGTSDSSSDISHLEQHGTGMQVQETPSKSEEKSTIADSRSQPEIEDSRKKEHGTPKKKFLRKLKIGTAKAEHVDSSQPQLPTTSETSTISAKRMPVPQMALHFSVRLRLQVRVYLFQARDLLPIKNRGFSDHTPFVYASFLEQCQKSQTLGTESKRGKSNMLNPRWNQTLLMDLEFNDDPYRLRCDCPNVILEVFSQDYFGRPNFMGLASFQPSVPVFQEEEKTPSRPKLAWQRIAKGSLYGGDILASAEVFIDDSRNPPPVSTVPHDIQPSLQPTDIELVVWGVRNMKTYKLFAVERPSVVIGIGDVEVESDKIWIKDKSANFKKNYFHRKSNLPREAIYRPPIVIRVKDSRNFGSCPTVGECVINDSTPYYLNYEPPEAPQSRKESDKVSEETKDDSTSAVVRPEHLDWWSKYNASKKRGVKAGTKPLKEIDTIKVYTGELENQEGFKGFSDVLQTFHLYRRKEMNGIDESREVIGELKGKILMYSSDREGVSQENKISSLPSTDPVNVKVRVYVVKCCNLASRDYNGLADPYLKINAGKKEIDDRSNFLRNTLDPIFGRMFELDLVLPIEKDLRITVFDWDLVGSDDKIGETVIDLENRYYSKYKAWCGLPKSYCKEGINAWRGQMTPKKWLRLLAKELKTDEPVWNGDTCVHFNKQKYMLSDFESGHTSPEEDESERLALHVLKEFPHVDEHVESRPLRSRAFPRLEQGRIELWVDMFPKKYLDEPLGDAGEPVNITPRGPAKYFARVVIWECCEIEMSDENIYGDRMSDIYIKGWLEGQEIQPQKTDVHYRSLDGTAMFNWRFVFPFDYIPQERCVVVKKNAHRWDIHETTHKVAPVLQIQAWDNDLFSPNDYLSEITIPLHKTPKCAKTHSKATLDKLPSKDGESLVSTVDMFEQKRVQGWWPLYKNVDGDRIQAGKIKMAIEVFTEKEHVEKLAGKARDLPNENPKLNPPKRPATSFAWFSSPLMSFRHIVWKRHRRHVIMLIVLTPIITFLALLIYTLPTNINNLVLKSASK